MVWTNWQRALRHGAFLVLLCWTGLAWTQSPEQMGASNPTERIMIVHENGKSTRCRVVESWKLSDGRIAHLLQSLETGDMLTIVDDQAPNADQSALLHKNPRAMPKRIFPWGRECKRPPEGSPVPPHLRFDSGLVLKNDSLPPSNADIQQGMTTILREIDERDLGKQFSVHSEGTQKIEFNPGLAKSGTQTMEPPTQLLLEDKLATASSSTNIMPTQADSTAPITSEGIELLDLPSVPATSMVTESGTIITNTKRPWRFGDKIQALMNAKLPTHASRSDEMISSDPRIISPTETIVVKDSRVPQKKPAGTGETSSLPFSTSMVNLPPIKAPVLPRPEKTPLEIPGPAASVVNMPTPTGSSIPASVTPMALSPVTPLDAPPVATTVLPSVMPTILPPPDLIGTVPNTKTNIAPPPHLPDKIVLTRDGVKAPTANTSAKPGTSPAGAQEKIVPHVPTAPKRDMWGTALSNNVNAPGRSVLEPASRQPEDFRSDPLLTPERLTPNDSRLRSKIIPPPEPKFSGDYRTMSSTMEPQRPAPTFDEGKWPAGTQSVLAAKNGPTGPIIYVPVPTMTMPQPNRPPLPPEPRLDAPQLNAYVNAFTPPPAPKNPATNEAMAPSMNAGVMMNSQALAQNPMLAQQLYYQQQMAQMYQQQMMQQQAMNPYGPRPNSGMMNAYMPQNGMMNPMLAQGMPATLPPATQGPAMNFARSYQGPQPPNPFGTNAPTQGGMMPTGYYPPMQGMTPQGMVQATGYQQPMVAPQYTAAAQVEQSMRVLRESPYPAQREWAAQSLVNFDWRSNPAIVPMLLQSATQDPAPNVRAVCVSTLGRMQAAVEPVLNTLNLMRNDSDPRVRQEVEQAFIRLGQASSARAY